MISLSNFDNFDKSFLLYLGRINLFILASILKIIFFNRIIYAFRIDCIVNLSIKFIFSMAVWLFLISAVPAKAGLIDSLRCQRDTSILYALHVPEIVPDSKGLIYILDPAGRAMTAIQKFQLIAENRGYFLVCSYSSFNSTIRHNQEVFEIVMDDLSHRYQYPQSQLLLAGFSGGSRAAFAIAENANNRVRGVIGCGSGLPPNTVIKRKLNFAYVGIIGEEDMNFYEMYDLNTRMEEIHTPSHFLYFQGGHSWPPVTYLRLAVLWFELQNMQSHQVKDSFFIEHYYERYLQTLRNSNSLREAEINIKSFDEFNRTFSSCRNMEEFIDSLSRFKAEPDIKKAVKKFLEARSTFSDKQRSYLELFRKISNYEYKPEVPEPDTWWISEIRFFNGLIKKKDPEYHLLGIRLRDFIWRMCAEQGSFSFQRGHFLSVIEFDKIWSIAQPESFHPHLRSATCYLQLDSHDRALTELKIAITKGFRNKNYVEEKFNKLGSNKRYQKILNQLSVNN